MGGLLRPFVAGPARHALRLLREPEYRTLAALESRLGRMPRRTRCRARAHGWTLEIPDAASFLESYREIFVDRRYDFPWKGPPPAILDLGANVGLSVLRFKHRHPSARVTAVEPDPMLFEVLQRNVHGNGFGDVELLQRAAWTTEGPQRFRSDGADGGRVAEGGSLEVLGLDVPALLASRPFDAVKMDIEGAEARVLPACREGLRRVRYLAVEYHSPAGGRQALAEALRVLEDCGFRVHLHSVVSSPTPFLELRDHDGFDLQLNLFGWRP